MTSHVLYVYAPAGPPLDYAMEKLAARAQITTAILFPPSTHNRNIIEGCSAKVLDLTDEPTPTALDRVEDLAKSGEFDALFTFSEFLLRSVTMIAQGAGLRSAGANVSRARDKLLMRQAWQQVDLPQPAFAEVKSLESADDDVAGLNLPIVLKSANGAGSIGLQVVRERCHLRQHLDHLLRGVDEARRQGKHEFEERTGFPRLIAEEMIVASTYPWYDVDGYGDFASIEGLVKDRTYYPLAMTGRFPTIEPFTELGNIAPSIIDTERKDHILSIVTKAIDVLELENCATHTELKLLPDGSISLLETAARMGGVAIANELEIAFGLDYVGLFLGTLLAEDEPIPAFEASPTGRHAASLALIATDGRGTPWATRRLFSPGQVDWRELAGEHTDVTIVRSQSIPPNTAFPSYDVAGGVMNYAGQAFLRSDSAVSLRRAAYRILDGLERHLPLLS